MIFKEAAYQLYSPVYSTYVHTAVPNIEEAPLPVSPKNNTDSLPNPIYILSDKPEVLQPWSHTVRNIGMSVDTTIVEMTYLKHQTAWA